VTDTPGLSRVMSSRMHGGMTALKGPPASMDL
jgi:hypothetical protein